MDTPKVKAVPAKETAEVAAPDDEYREPTKEELMQELRQALREVKAGYKGQDAMEFLDELEREAMLDADDS